MRRRDKKVRFLTKFFGGLLLLSSIFAHPQNGLVKESELDSLDRLRREINLLNLINGLNLSENQTKHILSWAREATEVREKMDKAINELSTLALDYLLELKEVLMETHNVPLELARKIHELQEKVRVLRGKGEAQIEALTEEVWSALSESQLYLLDGFIPCLLPPNDPQNLGNIGQAPNFKGPLKLLQRIREMPEERFKLKKEILIGEIITRLKRNHTSIQDEEKERERIEEFLNRVRSLSDLEFELKKEDLVKELFPRRTKEGHFHLDTKAKIQNFLLNPLMVPM